MTIEPVRKKISIENGCFLFARSCNYQPSNYHFFLFNYIFENEKKWGKLARTKLAKFEAYAELKLSALGRQTLEKFGLTTGIVICV